jgi:LmbE family N-acetylglucosaminyl deacetylase
MVTDLNETKKVLLAVLAHPDDESFGMGGTLALYASKGVDVHLVCATRGEVGYISPEYMQGFNSVAEKREAELRCAAGILGLKGVYYLDYRDSGMPGSEDNNHPRALAAAPLEEVTSKVVEIIRTVKPQVILTFDPIGGYRHPDHIAMHRATVAAFKAAGDPEHPSQLPPYQPQKLYYHTFSRRFLRWIVRLMPLFRKDPSRWGRNGDIDLASLAIEDFPIHARIDYRPVADKKEQAAACHASQDGHRITAGIAGWIFRITDGKEAFIRAYPEPQPGQIESDLFSNLEDPTPRADVRPELESTHRE